MSKSKRASLPPKITRPRVQRVLVRARLFRVIDHARETPLVWVMAPPGAGKTTLISHYLELRLRKHLWYQVDAGDHDIAGLFDHLSRAADAMRGRARNPALPRYAPEYLPDIEAFFRMFFRALFERLPDSTTLIFDDYQELADDAAFHRALCTALEQMPQGRQIVIISRNVAPPAFARLWAGRRVALIDWEALKLTREETRRLVALQRKRSGSAPPENLHDQCEGWITGFILLLEQSRAAPATGAEQSRLPAAVSEYFEQIFEHASPELRRLWLRTAYLPRFTASTAARVSGMKSAPALVETLARRQFFMQRRGSGSATLQYHALWRDFLLHRTEAERSSGERLRLMRRSAAALRDQGDHEAALEIFFDAKDWRSAERLLLDSAEAFLAQGRWHTLHGWVSRLPPSAVAASPALLYWDAVCQTQIDPSESLPAIERAYEAFSDVRDAAGQASCASLAIASNFAEWGNFAQRGRWFRILEQLLARDPKFPDPVSEARAWSALLFVFSLEIGDFPFAEVCARRVLRLCRAKLPDTERLAAASHLLFYLNQLASAEDAREALQEFAPLAASDGLTPLQKATWHLSESTYLYHVGDTSGALRVNRKARALAGDNWRGLLMMLDLLDIWALLASTSTDLARRQLDGVASRLGRAQPGDVALYHHLRAWLALLEAQPHAAVEHADQATRITRQLAGRTSLVNSLCVYSLALAECSRIDEAAAAVDEAVRASTGVRGINRFTALAFKAELLRRQPEKRAEFTAALADAFATARQSGFVNCVVWIPALMARLCAEALSAGIETEHVERMIRSRELAPPAADTEIWPWRVRIYTLGRFDIAIDGRRLEFAGKAQKRPLDLLKMLAAFGGRKVAVERLTAELWPNAEGDAAYRAFKVSLHRLRRLLGSDEVVRVENGEVTLDSQRVFVDSWTFERWFTEANARNSGVALTDAAVNRVLPLYQGAFLGAEARPWALAARERLRSKFVRGLILAAEAQQRRGDWERAAASYERGVDVEPTAEEIYVRLMRCYQRLGRHAEALAVYRRCETVLTSLLESRPTRATRALYEELRRLV